MKHCRNMWFSGIWMQIILLCSLFAMHNGYAQADSFVYHPPNRGAAQNTVGGATRRLSIVRNKSVQVLAPKHVAITSHDRPRLYWYLQPRVRNTQRFQISLKKGGAPLLKVSLPAQIKGGIQSLDLAQHGLSLKPGVVYTWQVKLESLRRSQYQIKSSVVSSGNIKFTVSNSKLRRKLRRASPHQRPYLAASQGLWYDAIDGVSQLVNQGSRTAHWRRQRAVLLEQAKLTAVAKYDRQMAVRRR